MDWILPYKNFLMPSKKLLFFHFYLLTNAVKIQVLCFQYLFKVVNIIAF